MLRITFSGPTSNVLADGSTIDTYTGMVGSAGLPGGSGEVTVTDTFGTIQASDDVDSNYVRVQVTVTSNTFTFHVKRPSGAGSGTISADELTGKAIGSTTVTYILPSGGGAGSERHFDFNTPSSPTAAGYLGVGPVAYTAAAGLGWQNASILSFDRGGPTDLLRDGHYSTGNTFLTDLAAGTYEVTPTLGDSAATHDLVNLTVGGANITAGAGLVTQNVTTTVPGSTAAPNPGPFTERNFVITVGSGGGQLALTFQDMGGSDPNFTFVSLDIRPVANVLPITFSGPASVAADGLATDTYMGTVGGAGLAGGSGKVTVVSTMGTAQASDDVDPNYAGVQVLVAGNTFTFHVKRPSGIGGGSGTITADEITGKALGSTTVSYTVAPTRRFDFNAGSNVTAAGFLPVRGANLYTATAGFGWVTQALEFDRGSAPGVVTTALYQDGNYGTANIFEIQVTSAGTYGLRIYMGDAAALHDNMKVTAEGGATQTVTTPAGTFQAITLTGVDADSNGILTITFQDLGGADPNFVVNGIDVALGGIGSLPGAAPQLPEGGAKEGGTAEVLTAAELAPVVQEAEARWAATGLSGNALAHLQQAQVQIADLGSTGALGLTGLGGNVVRIDATAEGYGWYIDPMAGSDGAFTQVVTGTELHAAPGSPATGGMDLLTVVMHELGHVLGCDDLPAQAMPHDLMTETLAVGTRRLLPGAAAATGQPAVPSGKIDQFFALQAGGPAAITPAGSALVPFADLGFQAAVPVLVPPTGGGVPPVDGKVIPPYTAGEALASTALPIVAETPDASSATAAKRPEDDDAFFHWLDRGGDGLDPFFRG